MGESSEFITSIQMSSGASWNGPICGTCSKGYLGQHRCDPADLVAKAEHLMDLARQRFDEMLDVAEPVDVVTFKRICAIACDPDCEQTCHAVHLPNHKRVPDHAHPAPTLPERERGDEQ